MQQLVKSMISFSWGISLLVLRESRQVLSPKGPNLVLMETDRYLQELSFATNRALGPDLRKAFDYGDQIQRRMIDSAFSLLDTQKRAAVRALETGASLLKQVTHTISDSPKFGSDRQGPETAGKPGTRL